MDAPVMIDPRGQRFAAAITSVVLALVLIFSSGWLLAAQALIFAWAVVFGPARSPYGFLFAKLVRPRLATPAALEDARPPRFAQAVGLAFTLIGCIGYFAGVPLLGAIATAFALVAALLNATIGFCLGCEMYLLLRRLAPNRG